LDGRKFFPQKKRADGNNQPVNVTKMYLLARHYPTFTIFLSIAF